MSLTWLSHLQGQGPTPGQGTKTLSAAWLARYVSIFLPFGKAEVFCQHSVGVLQELFDIQMYFCCVCGEVGYLYVLLLHHLEGAPYVNFFKNIFIYLFIFIYFWLHWIFIAAHRLSLVASSEGYCSLRCTGFSLRWLLLLWSTGSRHAGFSSSSMQAQQLWLMGSRAQAQQLWRTVLVAPRHVGSSQTRARTRVPCIGRRILNHCATREANHHMLILKV